MKSVRSTLIDTYRFCTWPVRAAKLQTLKHQGKVPIGILFYHRVDDESPNPWTISNQGFCQQIEWMQNHFDLVGLEECQRRIKSGFNDRPTLSITFDDGYADNCLQALPMLIERNIPVTYFVTTHHTLNDQPFPHDVDLGKPLTPNNLESLRALVAAGVEIGGHTRTHTDLGSISDEAQLFDEVIAATHEMEAAVGQKIRYFAFPFGQKKNLNPRVFELLRENGFQGVCSAYGGFNQIDDDAFHLQRIHGDPNFARMKNWLTYDPRLGLVERYDYQSDSLSK